MKRAFRLLLLLGALIGLFGQQAAYATSARASVTAAAVSPMDADCMAMMEKQPQPTQKPCKGLTLDCIAAMGCVLPVLLRDADAPLAAPVLFPVPAYWPSTSVLAGSDLVPEQHPPTTLG